MNLWKQSGIPESWHLLAYVPKDNKLYYEGDQA